MSNLPKLDLGSAGLLGGLAGVANAAADMYGKQAENAEHDRREAALILKEQNMARFRSDLELEQKQKLSDMADKKTAAEELKNAEDFKKFGNDYDAKVDAIPGGANPDGSTTDRRHLSDLPMNEQMKLYSSGLLKQGRLKDAEKALETGSKFSPKENDYSYLKVVDGRLYDAKNNKWIGTEKIPAKIEDALAELNTMSPEEQKSDRGLALQRQIESLLSIKDKGESKTVPVEREVLNAWLKQNPGKTAADWYEAKSKKEPTGMYAERAKQWIEDHPQVKDKTTGKMRPVRAYDVPNEVIGKTTQEDLAAIINAASGRQPAAPESDISKPGPWNKH